MGAVPLEIVDAEVMDVWEEADSASELRLQRGVQRGKAGIAFGQLGLLCGLWHEGGVSGQGLAPVGFVTTAGHGGEARGT
ncbi:hypothetical protein D3C71_2169090 [compost metagenome]